MVKDQRGGVILEFVLSCILVMVVLLGIVNVGFLIKDKLAVTAAAREAGREYAISQDWNRSVNAGYAALEASGVDRFRSAVTVSPGSLGTYLVTAEASCDSPVFFPGLGLMLGGEGRWEDYITVSSGPVIFALEP